MNKDIRDFFAIVILFLICAQLFGFNLFMVWVGVKLDKILAALP